MPSDMPLAVDLDGTLTLTDTLLESILKLAKERPLAACFIPWWLMAGKANLKRQIAQRVRLKAELLPYNQPLLSYLKQAKQAGRQLILITASDEIIARQVADALGIFEATYGSNGRVNCSGQQKAEVLIKQYGNKTFAYAGNSMKDIPVWRHAAQALVVNANQRIQTAAQAAAPLVKVFPPQPLTWRNLRQALRPHQWLKNILLFVPILTAHQLNNPKAVQAALIGFLAFSLTASAIYTMNDLLDLEADRLHPTKRRRPFAAGTLHPIVGLISIPLLIIASAALSWHLPARFLILLGAYGLANIAYSLRLKQVALLDVIVLACLYTLRILSGSAATGIGTSSWLFVFAMFIFLSLALIKRVAELVNLRQQSDKPYGRGYTNQDIMPLTMIGISSGFLSLLVLALYISSDTVRQLYTHPQWLWFLVPLLILWISRIWLVTSRGTMNEDPILFAAKDSLSHTIALAALLTLFIAT